MSKIFLLNQSSMFELDKNESFCFLFPMELLYEGFISGFIQDVLQGEAKVTLQASDLSLVDDIIIGDVSHGAAFKMRHDILVENKENIFILDTKYKGISRMKNDPDALQNISQEIYQPDLYQMFAYAIKRNIKNVYLLYPMYRFENEDDIITKLIIPFVNDDKSYKLTVHIIRLPFVFEEDDIEFTKSRLTNVINNILSS